MTEKDAFEQAIGIKLMVIVAGLIGGIVQLAQNPKITPAGAVVSVVAGMACAAFVTPLLHWYWSVPISVENATAFFMGLLGMQITGKVYQWFTAFSLSEFISNLIRKK